MCSFSCTGTLGQMRVDKAPSRLLVTCPAIAPPSPRLGFPLGQAARGRGGWAGGGLSMSSSPREVSCGQCQADSGGQQHCGS